MLTAVRFGIIFALMEFIWIIGEYLVGLHTTYIRQHYLYTNLIMIPATAIMVWGLVARRDELGGALTYLQALGQGALTGMFVGIVSIGVHYLFFTYINPNFFSDFQKLAVDEGHMSYEAAETYFSLSSYAWQSALFSPVAGLLTNAIAGLFLKTSWR
ncbi:MAG: DUF4199 domain-containing protein [Bacteroidota bacterium]|jgi:hypothetical protein